jgi:hypothetical protein
MDGCWHGKLKDIGKVDSRNGTYRALARGFPFPGIISLGGGGELWL